MTAKMNQEAKHRSISRPDKKSQNTSGRWPSEGMPPNKQQECKQAYKLILAKKR